MKKYAESHESQISKWIYCKCKFSGKAFKYLQPLQGKVKEETKIIGDLHVMVHIVKRGSVERSSVTNLKSHDWVQQCDC